MLSRRSLIRSVPIATIASILPAVSSAGNVNGLEEVTVKLTRELAESIKRFCVNYEKELDETNVARLFELALENRGAFEEKHASDVWIKEYRRVINLAYARKYPWFSRT